jgi:hypothetical protein
MRPGSCEKRLWRNKRRYIYLSIHPKSELSTR